MLSIKAHGMGGHVWITSGRVGPFATVERRGLLSCGRKLHIGHWVPYLNEDIVV